MKYKVGDKVKRWSKMFEEFGLDSNGNIDCKHGFIRSMKYLCGKEMTIEEVVEDDERYVLAEDCDFWSWSDDMLEGVEE